MEQNDYLKMSENGKTVFSCKKDYEGTVVIPEGVTWIRDDAFVGCTNLISITIPSSVATIQSWAFRRCTSLKEIHLKHKNPKNFAEAFKDIDPSNITIYVPKGSVKAYRNSIHYKSFKTIIEEE